MWTVGREGPFGDVEGMKTRSVYFQNAARITIIAGLFFATTIIVRGQATGMQGSAALHEYRTAGGRTASGERFDPESMTAASNDLPFDSLVRVTRIDNGKTIVVRINDRTAGDEHIIHLSDAAARYMGVTSDNPVLIKLRPLRPENLTVLRRPGKYTLPKSSFAADRTVKDRSEEIEHTDDVVRHTSGEKSQTVSDPLLRFTLQVGVFSSRQSADNFSGEISESWVSPVTVQGKKQYRVYFSRFAEESPARLAQKSLRRQGRDSFLRAL